MGRGSAPVEETKLCQDERARAYRRDSAGVVRQHRHRVKQICGEEGAKVLVGTGNNECLRARL